MAETKIQPVPIASLSLKSKGDWIRARVAYKSNLNVCGNGRKRLQLHLMDESDIISAVAFGGEAERFFELFEIEKIYNICVFNISPAEKQYTKLEHNYELRFNFRTTIKPHTNDSDVPQISFNFVPIDQIVKMPVNAIVDCIAACREASVLKSGRTNNKRIYYKRTLRLFDNSNAVIELILWDSDACKFDNHPPFIIAVKRAIVDIYNGIKLLNAKTGSVIKINPDFPENHSLREWYGNEIE